MQVRKNYWALDAAKLLCALTIISAHFAAEWGKFPTLIDYGFSIYVIAVPFFFCCSGFLFFKKMNQYKGDKERNSYFWAYQKRLWIMYGCWTLVYLPFVVFSWIERDIFGWRQILKWLHMAVVIQTYATIWFLPALAIGIALVYFLVFRLDKRKMIVLSVLLYTFGALGYTYNFLVEGTLVGDFYDIYLLIFKTTRNGLFNAAPFVYMGCLIAGKEVSAENRPQRRYVLLAAGSLFMIAAESFCLKLCFQVTGMDIGIFIVPFVYFFTMMLVGWELRDHRIWLWCRKCSMLIFLSQRLFLSALPSVFPTFFGALYSNSYVGLLLLITMTTVFSMIFIEVSKHCLFLKRMA